MKAGTKKFLCRLLGHILTIGLAVVGWIVAHSFTAARDLNNARRQIRTQYLIEAYRKLERASNWKDALQASWPAQESAIADIQLFGSPQQVALAHDFVREMVSWDTADSTPLLLVLRDSLREELNLGSAGTNILFFRIGVTNEVVWKTRTGSTNQPSERTR